MYMRQVIEDEEEDEDEINSKIRTHHAIIKNP